MEILKRNTKWILGVIVLVVLVSGVSVYATTTYLASQVTYKDGKTVEEALNELYKNAKGNISIDTFDEYKNVTGVSTAHELNLTATKDSKKSILVYTVGAGDNGPNAISKGQTPQIVCSSAECSIKQLQSKNNISIRDGNYYSGSALQEIYEIENLKQGDTIKITGYSQFACVCYATLISCY